MRIRTAFVIISALAVSALANAQNTLTIGDKAPEFKVAGFVKGDKIGSIEKGKTYVVEFWATWCGPCIASMPHLSDMADKYQGKATFVSVNTWDYSRNPEKKAEAQDVHEKRVADWVSKNSDKMRYNVVLDDDKDTIATTWMRAAGRNGIPCAFIVNEEGKIAWIGHPMQMDKPLEEIANKTWDLAKFKKEFDEQAVKAKAAAEAQKKLATDIKDGNKTAIEAYIAGGKGEKVNEIFSVINLASRSNAPLAYEYYKKYEGKLPGVSPINWIMLAGTIASASTDATVKADLAKISEGYASKSDAKMAAVAYTYHAIVLNGAGDKEGAEKWIAKAKAAIDTYEPATQKDNLTKFIEDTAKGFKK